VAGVGAHHHNGVAEASIKHVIASARTMQIHAALRWPDASDWELWPMALSHAVALHNLTPNMQSGYPLLKNYGLARAQLTPAFAMSMSGGVLSTFSTLEDKPVTRFPHGVQGLAEHKTWVSRPCMQALSLWLAT
jgi:hypothetical protein